MSKLRFFFTWLGITLLIFPASCTVSCIGAGVYLLQHREKIEGKMPPEFPVMIVLPGKPLEKESVVAQFTFELKSGGRAEIVQSRELESVQRDHPDATFLIPQSEVAGLNELMDKQGDGPNFSEIEVRDTGDGHQEVHLNASFYDDNGNESWYTASAHDVQPRYWHRHGPFLSFPAFALGFIPAALIALVFAFLVTMRRSKRAATAAQ